MLLTVFGPPEGDCCINQLPLQHYNCKLQVTYTKTDRTEFWWRIWTSMIVNLPHQKIYLKILALQFKKGVHLLSCAVRVSTLLIRWRINILTEQRLCSSALTLADAPGRSFAHRRRPLITSTGCLDLLDGLKSKNKRIINQQVF